MSNSLDEFYGMSPPWDQQPTDSERVFHEGGLDQIDPAFDQVSAQVLAGAIGYDPTDLTHPSIDTRQDIEQQLPQWGPPFVKFVDHRISELEKLMHKAMEKWAYETVTMRSVASGQTSGTGGINLGNSPNSSLVIPPPGFTAAIHRMEVVLPGSAFTFAAPFNGAGSYWELRLNNEAIDGGSLVAAAVLRPFGLPFVLTYGTRDAPRVRDGEVLSFFLNAGPNNQQITIKTQFSYDRTIEG